MNKRHWKEIQQKKKAARHARKKEIISVFVTALAFFLHDFNPFPLVASCAACYYMWREYVSE